MYLVSTKPSGDKVWWTEAEAKSIPGDHTGVRRATDAEALVMSMILKQDASGRMPSKTLGDKIKALLAA